jgi:hypothetical protein
MKPGLSRKLTTEKELSRTYCKIYNELNPHKERDILVNPMMKNLIGAFLKE